MTNNRRNHIDLTWGDGATELFFAPNVKFELLDYEFDTDQIHNVCGGKCYHKSISGYSGAGYITSYGILTPVGGYRVDTVYNDFQYPKEIAKGISLMVPYRNHEKEKNETLKNNPVVIKVGRHTVIYCSFYTNMTEILKTVLSGEELAQEPKILKRSFVYSKSPWDEEEEKIRFYNLFGDSNFSPWDFMREELAEYRVAFPKERLYQIFHLATCNDGRDLVTTQKNGWRSLYATDFLPKDPLEKMDIPPKGWELGDTNLVYKLHENEVYIVGWEMSKNIFWKRLVRVLWNHQNPEGFIKYVEKNLDRIPKYFEFELKVSKLLFYMDKKKQFALVRKGIAKKVRNVVETLDKEFSWQISH